MSTKWWFGAFRDRGAPTWYGDNRTPVVTDPTTVKISIAFGIFLVAFLVDFPGIRRTKWTSFLTTTLALIVGVLLIICTYYPAWHVAEEWIMAPYRSFSSERVNALLGVNVGLKYVNITLNGYPVGKYERRMNYNERFAFNEVKSMQNDLRAGLQKGLPYPSLSAIEYFSVDKAGFTWGRRYRLAGYYTCILLWLSFALWLLHLIVLCLVPQFYSRILMCLGACILLSDLVYVMACPKTLYMPFHTARGYTAFLVFEFGWCLWTSLAAGLACFIYGVFIRVFELRTSYRFFTFMHEYDEAFDDAKKTPWAKRRDSLSFSANLPSKDISASAVATSLTTTGRLRFDESTVAKLRSQTSTDQSSATCLQMMTVTEKPSNHGASVVPCGSERQLSLVSSFCSSSDDSSIADQKSVCRKNVDEQTEPVEQRDIFVEQPSTAEADDGNRSASSSRKSSQKCQERTERQSTTNRLRTLLSPKRSTGSSTSSSSSWSTNAVNISEDFAVIALESVAMTQVELDSCEQATESTTRPIQFSLMIDGNEQELQKRPEQSLFDAQNDNGLLPSTSHDVIHTATNSCPKSVNSDADSSIVGQSSSVSTSCTFMTCNHDTASSAHSINQQPSQAVGRSAAPCAIRVICRRPSSSAVNRLQRRCSNLTSYAADHNNHRYKHSDEPYRSAFIDLSFPGFDDKLSTNSSFLENRWCEVGQSSGCSLDDQRTSSDLLDTDCSRSKVDLPMARRDEKACDTSTTVGHCARNGDRWSMTTDDHKCDHLAPPMDCSVSGLEANNDQVAHDAQETTTTADNRAIWRGSRPPSKVTALKRLRANDYAGSNCPVPVSKLQRYCKKSSRRVHLTNTFTS